MLHTLLDTPHIYVCTYTNPPYRNTPPPQARTVVERPDEAGADGAPDLDAHAADAQPALLQDLFVFWGGGWMDCGGMCLLRDGWID